MSKIHYLLKISIIFIILGIFSSLLPSETYLTFSSSNIAMTLSPIESLLFLYSVILCFELAAVIFSFVVNLIKKDVLISNHKFFGENDSITIIEANNNAETMVLSRNQFDEAAILIVRALGDISSGLMNNARRNLVLLRRIIGDDSIIDLLMLKIYKGEKNLDKIEGLSQKLMKSESISLVGMKAAFEVQMKKKEFNEALKTVNSAFEVRQDLYWVLNSAFLLRAKDNDWLGALEILQAGINKNITPLKKAKRLKAIALYELSKDALAEKDETKFFKFINQALAENNKLLPAAIDLANYYKNHDKQTRKAQQVLYNIWCVNPTYEIAQAYLNLYPKDSKINKIQRMEKLALYNKLRPSLNNIILAELYLDAKKYSNATSECKMFLLKNPATQKINEILNVLAKKSRKKSKDNELLDANIENYPADFQWACANCGHLSSKWEAICPECNEIGRNYWHLYIDNNKK